MRLGSAKSCWASEPRETSPESFFVASRAPLPTLRRSRSAPDDTLRAFILMQNSRQMKFLSKKINYSGSSCAEVFVVLNIARRMPQAAPETRVVCSSTSTST